MHPICHGGSGELHLLKPMTGVKFEPSADRWIVSPSVIYQKGSPGGEDKCKLTRCPEANRAVPLKCFLPPTRGDFTSVRKVIVRKYEVGPLDPKILIFQFLLSLVEASAPEPSFLVGSANSFVIQGSSSSFASSEPSLSLLPLLSDSPSNMSKKLWPWSSPLPPTVRPEGFARSRMVEFWYSSVIHASVNRVVTTARALRRPFLVDMVHFLKHSSMRRFSHQSTTAEDVPCCHDDNHPCRRVHPGHTWIETLFSPFIVIRDCTTITRSNWQRNAPISRLRDDASRSSTL